MFVIFLLCVCGNYRLKMCQVVGHTLFAVSLTRNTTLTCPFLISILKQNTGSSPPNLNIFMHRKLSLQSYTLQHIGIQCECFSERC